MRQTRTSIAIAAFVLAAILSYLGAIWAVKGVERRTRQIVSHELSLAGLDWVKVTTDGLQVRLAGTAPNEATRFRVIAVVDAAVDASRVHDQMQTAPAKQIDPPRFSVELLRNDDGISLIGLVPASTGHEAIARKVAAVSGDGKKVHDLLETADAPVPEGWDDALNFGLTALKLLPHSKISIAAGHVVVTGISDSRTQQHDYETALTNATPKGLKVDVNISAPRPVITPFTLRFVIDSQGARFDACSADTEKARGEILAAARTAGASGKLSCTIGMGVPSPHWAEAARLGIAAVKDLGLGSVTFSDADVTLLAPPDVSQAKFDRVAGDLGAKLPDVFSLTSTLEKPEKKTKATGPVQFSATLLPSGKLSLRGRLLDDRQRDAVDSYAKARFGAGKVFTATTKDKALPDGWPIRVLAGLQALSILHDGSLLVQPDNVTIAGTSGVQDAKDQISRILSDKLGPGQGFTIKVDYNKALDPEANLPTPKQCLATIQTALKGNKINFEPGSDSFTADSAPTLDQVAAELRKCPGLKLEIAGYTDSQGRPEMNLALSQARAQAVLQALAARRVLVGNIVARGYGEEHPIASNKTEAGREANRRIEITLQSESPDANAPNSSDPTAQNADSTTATGQSAGDGTTVGTDSSAQGQDGSPPAPAAQGGDSLAPSQLDILPKPRPGTKN